MKKKEQVEQNKWKNIQNDLADKSGTAIVVVDKNSAALYEANNNSICKTLYSSDEFSSECDKFCGKAFEMANQTGIIVEYECYAGLDCRAVPIKKDGETEFAAIVGKAFRKTSNYRAAAERAISGDWSQFPPSEFFENVLLKGAVNDLEVAAKIIENLDDEKKDALIKFAENENIEVTEKSDQPQVADEKAVKQSGKL
ncbi:MAG: PocR ligand-binding domain-containing protein, partial [Aridibacter sp.]